MDEEEIVLGAQAIAATGRFLAAVLVFVLVFAAGAAFDLLPWRPHSAGDWALVGTAAIAGSGLSMSYGTRLWALIKDPLVGRTSLGAAVWAYGLLGSLIYSAFGLFLDAGSTRTLRLYTIGGFVYSLYATVAVYQCARNARSRMAALLARVCAILSLVLLLLVAYLYATGAFDGLLASLDAAIG
jgi:hypothetical protein